MKAGVIAGMERNLLLWRRRMRVAREFSPFLRPHRASLALAVVLSIGCAAATLCEPWPLQVLIDGAVLGKPTKLLGRNPLELLGGDKQLLVLVCSGAVLLLAAISGTIYYFQSVLLARVGQDMVRELRQTVFHKLQRLSLPFHRRSDSGDLLMRLTGDMILLREMIVASLVTMTTHLVMLASTLALMITVSPRLTLVAVVLAPLLYVLVRVFRGRMVEAARQQRRREGSLAASLEEVLLAIPMIQAFTAEKTEDERFRQICKKSARAGLRGARLEAAMQRMVAVLLALGTALVLWAGTRSILRGDLTPGLFLVFLAYLRSLYRPIRGLSKVAERTARATAASERIVEILSARREVKDSKHAVPAPRLRGGLSFRDVTFSYEEGSPALSDISFEIKPGERIALVGPTGAGKTTLVALLFRFYNPDCGQILVDGVPIRTYTLHSLRSQISFLSQDPFVLGVSVRENLLYGKPDATDEELWTALRAVGMEELVRVHPESLDLTIRPRGQSLSGGQKQRLAIARAMLKDSPVLILDEPTTGLDARSEQEVLRSLDRLRAGRTTLTIAHHLATIRNSDRILVLERGRLVESGPPEDLLSHDTLFRVLAQIQGLAPADGPVADRRPLFRPHPDRERLEQEWTAAPSWRRSESGSAPVATPP